MPEGSGSGCEDSAGPNLVPTHMDRLPALAFSLEYGDLRPVPTQRRCIECLRAVEPFGPDVPSEPAERLLLASRRIFAALRQ